MKRVAILQSNYIPWKGYFDLIAAVDEFIIYDEVQFTRRDWRNRNLIKTDRGQVWLTVPVMSKGLYTQTINATRIANHDWQSRHWHALATHYRHAPYFDKIAAWLEPLYRAQHDLLAGTNRVFLNGICQYLGINTLVTDCRQYALIEGKTERLVSLCKQAEADVYVSGPAAKAYLDEGQFSAAGVAVEWFDYGGYPEYPQLWSGFVHEVSVLDLLFNCGPDAANYMKYVR